VFEEYDVKGKQIDVLAQDIKTKYIIANEVELSARHCLENIKRDLKVGCNEVVIICEDGTTLETIKQKTRLNLDKNMLCKVRYRIIRDFVPHARIRNNTE
jgi:hypothetical protein